MVGIVNHLGPFALKDKTLMLIVRVFYYIDAMKKLFTSLFSIMIILVLGAGTTASSEIDKSHAEHSVIIHDLYNVEHVLIGAAQIYLAKDFANVGTLEAIDDLMSESELVDYTITRRHDMSELILELNAMNFERPIFDHDHYSYSFAYGKESIKFYQKTLTNHYANRTNLAMTDMSTRHRNNQVFGRDHRVQHRA